jgi:4-hydroxysphinganine ceramide fatty acyl 2-hydroxylase
MLRLRLVFPPVLLGAQAFLVTQLILWIFPGNHGFVILGGGMLGYVLYDCSHFMIHHGKLNNWYLKEIRNYHNRHHYENPKLGYGVTSKFWDLLYSSQLP